MDVEAPEAIGLGMPYISSIVATGVTGEEISEDTDDMNELLGEVSWNVEGEVDGHARLSASGVESREPRRGHPCGRREWSSVGLPWPTRAMRSALDCEIALPPAVGEGVCSTTGRGIVRGVGAFRYLLWTRSSRKNGCLAGLAPYTFFFVRPCTCCSCVTRLGVSSPSLGGGAPTGSKPSG